MDMRFVNKLRYHYQSPIIFISALSDEDNQLKAFELGADDFITKPFLPSVFVCKVFSNM